VQGVAVNRVGQKGQKGTEPLILVTLGRGTSSPKRGRQELKSRACPVFFDFFGLTLRTGCYKCYGLRPLGVRRHIRRAGFRGGIGEAVWSYAVPAYDRKAAQGKGRGFGDRVTSTEAAGCDNRQEFGRCPLFVPFSFLAP
jgi:hypothetical protein